MKHKRILWILPVLLLAGGIIAWLAARTSPDVGKPMPDQGAKVPLVETQAVRIGDLPHTLELTGEVAATDSVVIAATSEGPIAFSPWREGDEVKAGEKLIEIEREIYRAEVETAKAMQAVAEAKLADLKAGTRPEEIEKASANVARWQATLTETRKAYERQKQLIKQDFTSQQSLDQALEQADVAAAELQAARETLRMLKAGPTATELAVQQAAVKEATARLALAEAHLAECVITAPFDGRISHVHVRAGDLAVPRIPLIEMYAPASLVVKFSMPEVYSAAAQPGLQVAVTLDAFPDRILTGKIVRVYPQLDPLMRTRTVEAKLDQTDGLMPNQFARISVLLAAVGKATIIPAEALIETPQGKKVVFVVEKGKASRREVVCGIETGKLIQVVSGVTPGEQVVVRGNEGLKNGATVRVPEAGPVPKKPGPKSPAGKPAPVEDNRQ